MLGVLAVAVAGAWVGATLSPSTTAFVGPLQAELRVVPSLHPGVHLLLPPAGEVTFRTHVAPFAVEARISEVDVEGARRLLASPGALLALERGGPEALRTATLQAAATTAACAVAGALILGLLVYRTRWRVVGVVVLTVLGVLGATTGLAVTSFDPDRFAQPHFTGLLSQAPYIAGDATSLVQRLESYRSGLADIVQGVTALYATSGGLPVLPDGGSGGLVTVLHVSDVHLNPLAFDLMQRLVTQFSVSFVVDTGDITTWGTEVESQTLGRIRSLRVPYVFVRGNHDSRATQQAVRANPNALVLDDDVALVDGVVLAGIGDPAFTPDADVGPLPSPSGTGVPSPSSGTSTGGLPGTSTGGLPGTSTGGLPGTPPGEVPGTTTAREIGGVTEDPQTRSHRRLADLIQAWDLAHPDHPVTIAAVHEPFGLGPLLGRVPVILAGHTHHRVVNVESGTRVMVEGSTGGAGITAGGFARLSDGSPLPLAATLLYIARSGPRTGQVVAYDEVTVGGFGLASVTLVRHVVRPEDATPPSPTTPSSNQTPSPTTPSNQTPSPNPISQAPAPTSRP